MYTIGFLFCVLFSIVSIFRGMHKFYSDTKWSLDAFILFIGGILLAILTGILLGLEGV